MQIIYVFVVQFRSLFELFTSLSYLYENNVILSGDFNVAAYASGTTSIRAHSISEFSDLFCCDNTVEFSLLQVMLLLMFITRPLRLNHIPP